MNHSIAIVTPLYKQMPTHSEAVSLKHSFDTLGRYRRIVIAPESLDLFNYDAIIGDATTLRLDDQCFDSIATYNRLLLSRRFYKHFTAFEYMLILQPDAIVFRDELEYWCGCNFDYIGAPWPNGLPIRPYSFRWDHRLHEPLKWFNKPIRRFVGNGGLSLRKISSAITTLGQHRLVAKLWIANEDLFWSLYSPNVPGEALASKFAIEEDPVGYYQKNGNNLPFGCHAWERYAPDFWLDKFQQVGVQCGDISDCGG
jgi:hypothetical protein